MLSKASEVDNFNDSYPSYGKSRMKRNVVDVSVTSTPSWAVWKRRLFEDLNSSLDLATERNLPISAAHDLDSAASGLPARFLERTPTPDGDGLPGVPGW